ncbi:hypothetical protein HMPREF7215_0265 [Pyramidobacter piscolens W5455]|uniref:Uncharacterized protein n=1 Tax=Pyramidobacter piscolens W5455 TaxID=352165 RepID=A0ABP2HRR6_9BACT|nr:hypothetical protein HMPREF7215_0265 [Pyramidobacter piscolens W5455]
MDTSRKAPDIFKNENVRRLFFTLPKFPPGHQPSCRVSRACAAEGEKGKEMIDINNKASLRGGGDDMISLVV